MFDHDADDCPKCHVLREVYDPADDAEQFARCHDELTDATVAALAALERRSQAAQAAPRRPAPVQAPA